MNYLRIYNELIEHRKMLPRVEGVYYEKHHIKPRCMGGNDEPQNLIHLTAEDHFMAHLLLAKAHGGSLWTAAHAMTMPVSGRKIAHRRVFGIIKRGHIDSMTGENNPRYDHNQYTIIHTDTLQTFTGSRADITEFVGVTDANVCQLINNKMNTLKGYCLLDRFDEVPKRDQTLYEFEELATGKIHKCTYYNLAKIFGVSTKHIKKLSQGKMEEAYGFIIAGSRLRFTFLDVKTGEKFKATKRDAMKLYKISSEHMHILMAGKAITAKGLALYDFYVEHYKSEIVYTIQNINTAEIFKTTRRSLVQSKRISATGFCNLVSGSQKTSRGLRILSKSDGTWH